MKKRLKTAAPCCAPVASLTLAQSLETTNQSWTLDPFHLMASDIGKNPLPRLKLQIEHVQCHKARAVCCCVVLYILLE